MSLFDADMIELKAMRAAVKQLTDELNERCVEQYQLREENARLRAALEQIANVFDFGSSAGNMAREALKGQQ